MTPIHQGTVKDMVIAFVNVLICRGIGHLNKALQEHPGVAVLPEGEMDKAIKMFRKAMSEDNSCAWAQKFYYLCLYWKAEAWISVKGFGEAITCFQDCLAIKPDNNEVKGYLIETMYKASEDLQRPGNDDYSPPSPMYCPDSPENYGPT